jgi:hypothetical protein
MGYENSFENPPRIDEKSYKKPIENKIEMKKMKN